MSNYEEIQLLLDDYLNDRLPADSKEKFEKSLSQQPDLQEELVIHQNLMHVIGEQPDMRRKEMAKHPMMKEVLEVLDSEETRQLRATISEVNEEYQQNQGKSSGTIMRSFPLMAIAASIIILLNFGLVFWQDSSNADLYDAYKDSYSPISLVERSSSVNTSLNVIINALQAADYEKVITSVNDAPELVKQHAEVLLYLGLAYRETAQFDESIKAFERYAAINDLDQSIADWNIGLIYLKTEENAKAKSYFQKLAESTAFEGAADAQEILKNLE